MKSCPACGEDIRDDALKCKFCGVDLNLRKCPWCSEIIEKSAKKCKHCKTHLTKIRCYSCDELTEVTEMLCPDCIEKIVEDEVETRLARQKLKMDLAKWSIVLLLCAILYVLLNHFF